MADEFEMEDTLILIDEDEVEHEFEIEGFLEVDGKKYAVLFELNNPDNDDEAVIMRMEKDENDEDLLYEIEDDEEWEKVADAYNESLEEE